MVPLNIHMYIYIYIYIHIHIHVYMYTCIHVYMYTYIHIYVNMIYYDILYHYIMICYCMLCYVILTVLMYIQLCNRTLPSPCEVTAFTCNISNTTPWSTRKICLCSRRVDLSSPQISATLVDILAWGNESLRNYPQHFRENRAERRQNLGSRNPLMKPT